MQENAPIIAVRVLVRLCLPLLTDTGMQEPDYDSDVWTDHDEMRHGMIDTKQMRQDYPDGFRWSCCQSVGSATGCLRGIHEADPAASKSQPKNAVAGQNGF